MPYPVLEIEPEYRARWLNRTAVRVYGATEGLCYQLTHNSDTPCHLRGEICPNRMATAHGTSAAAVHVHHGREGLCLFNVTAIPMDHGGVLELHIPLHEAIAHDPLTGLYTRQIFDQIAQRQMALLTRLHADWGLLLLDLDRFKGINDDLGHMVGDDVLAAVGRVVLALMRASDTAGRWGGEELCVFVPAATTEGLRELGERLREGIANLRLASLSGRRVTVSIGAALGRGATHADFLDVFARADQALYRAKDAGRNRLVVA